MMRIKMAVNHLRKGMIIGEDIYTHTGVILVAQGTPVTRELVNLLSRNFIESVCIEYKAAGNVSESSEKSLVDPKQYKEFEENFAFAEDKLSDTLKDIVYNSKDVNINLLKDMTNEILEKSRNEVNLCNMLMMMKKNTETIYAHSINVSLLGQILAKWSNCTKEEIELVAVAGLLHDIGTLKFSSDVMKNYSFHKEMEGGVYDKHVIYGYELIKNQAIDDNIKKAVLTHHERLDGRGFPLKVKQEAISKISRILSIVDVYDTYTMNEKGNKQISVFDVLKKMELMHLNKYIDSYYTMIFIYHIAETLIGYKVMLSDNRIGKIVMINKHDILRPLVQMGAFFADLTKEKQLYIKEVLD